MNRDHRRALARMAGVPESWIVGIRPAADGGSLLELCVGGTCGGFHPLGDAHS